MISRAALGKPWIFEEIQRELKGEKPREITNKEKLEIILQHYNLALEEKGEYVGLREMRKHLCYYIKGEPNASEIREKINHLENANEVKELLKKYYNQ